MRQWTRSTLARVGDYRVLAPLLAYCRLERVWMYFGKHVEYTNHRIYMYKCTFNPTSTLSHLINRPDSETGIFRITMSILWLLVTHDKRFLAFHKGYFLMPVLSRCQEMIKNANVYFQNKISITTMTSYSHGAQVAVRCRKDPFWSYERTSTAVRSPLTQRALVGKLTECSWTLSSDDVAISLGAFFLVLLCFQDIQESCDHIRWGMLLL